MQFEGCKTMSLIFKMRIPAERGGSVPYKPQAGWRGAQGGKRMHTPPHAVDKRDAAWLLHPVRFERLLVLHGSCRAWLN